MRRWFAALFFLLVLAGYIFLAHPAVSAFRDSGDLAVSASTLGLAHPPGYPVYVLSSRLVGSLIPWGNPVYRINLQSALFAAGGILFLFLLLIRLGGSIAAWTGAPLAASFPPVLSQSGMSEVYALHLLIAAVMIWTAFRLSDCSLAVRSRGWVFLALLGGLGLGNHQSLLFVGIGLFLFMWRERRSGLLRLAFWGHLLLAFCVGLSVYLYLPIRGIFADYVWGEPGQLRGFWNILTRADYGAATLSTRYSSAGFGEGTAFWFRLWRLQWGVWGTLLGIASAVWALLHVRRSGWGGPLLVLWILSGPVFALLARMEPGELSAAILLPALLVPGALAAATIGLFLAGLGRKGFGWRVLALGLLLAFAGTTVFPGVLGQNQRWNLLASDYGRNLLRTTPPNSALLMISDEAIFGIQPQRLVWKHRQDIRTLVDAELPWRWKQYRRRYPELFEEGQADGGVALARFQSRRVSIFTEGMQSNLLDQLCPVGMAARVFWPRRDESCMAEVSGGLARWNFYVRRVPPALVLLNDYYSRQILRTVSSGAFNAGLILKEAGFQKDSIVAYARALFWDPGRLLRWREAF